AQSSSIRRLAGVRAVYRWFTEGDCSLVCAVMEAAGRRPGPPRVRFHARLANCQAASPPLPDPDPAPVVVADDELPHAVEGVVDPFLQPHDWLQLSEQLIDPDGLHVQVDLPSLIRSRMPAGTEHHATV